MRAFLSDRTRPLLERLALVVLLPLLILPACQKSPTTGPTDDNNTSAVPIIGYLDQATGDWISGWVWDSKQPDTTIKVDIFDGDKKLETVLADVFREDLVKAKTGGNGKHGFVYPTPQSLKDGKPHTIRAKVSGSNFELEGSPKTLKAP